MKHCKRVPLLLLVLALCLSLLPTGAAGAAGAAYTEKVFMISTNPGEDCGSQIRIGWHSNLENTNCYVMYTTSDDTEFANAIRVDGTYDDRAYKWFDNRLLDNGEPTPTSPRIDIKFLDWGLQIDHLKADTEYIYRVYDGEGLYSKDYKFKTAGADKYSIIWMSDAHVDYAGHQGWLINWRKMFKYAEMSAKYPVGFQISTGDTTISGDRYKSWLSLSREKFIRDYMLANVVGNHDVYDAIMYRDKQYYTDFWKSGEYFRIVYNNPENGYTFNSQRISSYYGKNLYDGFNLEQYADRPASELIPFGDEGKVCTGAVDNTSGRCYWYNYNGLLFINFEYYSMMYDGDTGAALEWAGRVIEQNEGKYDYIICSNHINLVNGGGGDFRIYGCTDYGHLHNFLDNYNVDVFLTGDNHVYVRTDSIYNGAVNTDPEKGTYIVQSPCLSRPQSFTAMDPSGFIVKQYSLAGKTVGGLVIDVDEAGLTFRCLVRDDDKNPQYYEYDSFTIPRKTRAKNRLELKPDASFDVLGDWLSADEGATVAAVKAGILNPFVTVTDADGNELPDDAAIGSDMTVTVNNEGWARPAAVLTVKIKGSEPAPQPPAGVPGDVNDDGEVDNLDATLVLQYDAGIMAEADLPRFDMSDVNGDGETDNLDAALILQFDAGIIEGFEQAEAPAP